MRRLVALAAAVMIVAPIGQQAGAEGDGRWDHVDLSVSGEYEPFVGDFAGDAATEVFWYAPGEATDTIYLGAAGTRDITRVQVEALVDAIPLVGDFGGDDHDDVLWYRPGTASDPLWIATGDEDLFGTDLLLEVNGYYRPKVLRDHRPGEKDRILWYRPGPKDDPIWDFDDDGGHTSINFQIISDAQLVVGEFDGDEREDVFQYGPGDLPDRVWRSRDRGLLGIPFTIIGDYQAVAVDSDPADDLLLYGHGSKPDRYLRNNGQPAFKTEVLDLPIHATAHSAGPRSAVLYSPTEEDELVYDIGGDVHVLPLGETRRNVAGGKRLLVGDLDGDARTDLVWYGPGALRDSIWYGHDPSLG